MLGIDIEYPLRSNALSAKSVLGGRVALTHNTGKGLKMESYGVSHDLGCLVKVIIGACPVKDPHTKEVDQN